VPPDVRPARPQRKPRPHPGRTHINTDDADARPEEIPMSPLRLPTRALAAVLALASIAFAGCTSLPEGVTPVTGFDAQRYMGEWYSVHRLDHSFERGLTNVSARYALQPDGSVQVINRGFDAQDCEWKQVIGKAKFVGSSDVARLKVSFFGPFYGGYNVFALDPEYRWAMVSGPNHGYLWILAREPRLAPQVRERLVAQARAAGFAVDELQTVDHGAPACANGGTPPAAPAAVAG
jgi:apolipoprotein D and lipocalin family protein